VGQVVGPGEVWMNRLAGADRSVRARDPFVEACGTRSQSRNTLTRVVRRGLPQRPRSDPISGRREERSGAPPSPASEQAARLGPLEHVVPANPPPDDVWLGPADRWPERERARPSGANRSSYTPRYPREGVRAGRPGASAAPASAPRRASRPPPGTAPSAPASLRCSRLNSASRSNVGTRDYSPAPSSARNSSSE